jgi:hypothetical protein
MLSALPASAAQPSEVEDLITRGVELRRRGEDAKALPLFKRAHELGGTPRSAAQLGLVEMQLGYRLESEAHLAEALAAQHEPWVDKYRSVLETTLRQVRSQIGELAVVGSPAGAYVTVNGRERGRLPLPPIRLPAGPAKIELSAEGYTDASATVVVRGQGQERVMLNLSPAGRPARKVVTVEGPGPAPVPESHWSTSKIAGATAIIGGGLLVLGGGGLLLIDKNETCGAPSGGMCRQRNQTRGPGWGLIGAGAAAIVVGGLIVYNSSSAEVAVGVSPSSIVLAGRF